MLEKFLRSDFMFIMTSILMFFLGYAGGTTTVQFHQASVPGIANVPALQAHAEQMDKTIDLLIVELFEEKRSRKICEEAVQRWTADARTRQEVKNEAQRLKENGK